MPGWMNHKLESRLLGEISTTSDMQMIPFRNLRYADDNTLMAEREEELKLLLLRVKDESEKASVKLSIKKLRSWHLVPSLPDK